MKAIPRILIAVLALMLSTATVAVADHGHDDKDRVSVVPADRVGGSTGGALVGDWYAENLSLPRSDSPFGGTANLCLDLGRQGKVLSPAGGIADATGLIEMTCTVKVGRPVLLVMTSADCSSAEEPPFFGETAREQRSCVTEFLKGLDITSITVSVDGAKAVDIHSPRFFEVSPQRRVVFPEEPVFDNTTPGPATFVAAAWTAEIRGMDKGRHVVDAALNLVAGGEQLVFPFRVTFKVVGGR